MASEQAIDRYVVNETLCYMNNKYGKLSIKQLKSIIYDFYNPEDLATAKDVLLAEMDKLDLGKWPRPPARRRNSNETNSKPKLDTDDIFNTFAYIDEKKMFERLPKFVALNPDMLPSSNWTEGDLIGVMNKFASIENQFESLNSTMAEHIAISKNVAAELNSMKNELHISLSCGPMNYNRIGATASSYPRVTKLANDAREQLLTSATGTDDSDDGMVQSNCWGQLTGATSEGPLDDFSVKITKKRKLQMSAEKRRNEAAAKASADKPLANNTIPEVKTRCKRENIIGTATTGSLFKAAKDLTRKRVFCVSNVDNGVTSTELSTFVESIKVRVISCFDTKTKFPDTRAFRICINKEDSVNFLDKNNWPRDIILREWIFKNKENNPGVQPAAAVTENDRNEIEPVDIQSTIQNG